MRTPRTPSWTKAGAKLKLEASSGLMNPRDQEFGVRIRTPTGKRQEASLQIRESAAQTAIRLGDEYMDPEDLPVERSVRTEDRKVDTLVKKYEDVKDPSERRQPQESMEEFRRRIFAWQKQSTELKMPDHFRKKIPIRKVTNRLKAGTPKAKWLTELEEEENLGIPTRFQERHIKGYHKAAMKRYFLTNRSYTLSKLYQK